MRHISVLLSVLLFGTTATSAAGWLPFVRSVTSSNSTSAVGINISPSQQIFADISKAAFEWFTHLNGSGTGEDAFICVDANGWPTDITHKLTAPLPGGTCTATPTFNQISSTLNIGTTSPAFYPGGHYDVFYTPGTCGLGYGSDATLVTQNQAAGHDVINVVPSSTGLEYHMTMTGTGGSQCKIFSITLSTLTANFQTNCASYSAPIDPRACFNPKYLQDFSLARSFRFMDAQCTTNNTNASAGTWAGRPTTGNSFWLSVQSQPGGPPCGLPVEVMVALANAASIDPWFNMPTLIDIYGADTYVPSFASYVVAHLNSNLTAYYEFSNETWNFGFTNFPQLNVIGQALPALYLQGTQDCSPNSQNCNRSVMGHTTDMMCADLATAYTGHSSLKYSCVAGMQAAGSMQPAIDCVSYIGDVAISSGTYNSGTGAVSLTTASAHGITVGQHFAAGPTGTGGAANLQLNDVTATAGTTGSTLNYTLGGAGTSTITGGGVGKHQCLQQTTPATKSVAIAPYFAGEPAIAWTAAGFDADGGKTTLFQEQNSGGVLPLAAGAPTLSGTSSAFTITGIGGVGCSPANGTVFAAKFNVGPAASSTLGVNGCTAIALLGNSGATPDNFAGAGDTMAFVYTSATASGAVTPAWRILRPGEQGGAGWMGEAHSWVTLYQTQFLPTYELLSYERGPGYSDCCANAATEITNLIVAANTDARMGTAIYNDLTFWKTSGGHLANHYNDVGIWGQFGAWALIQNTCGTDCTLSTSPSEAKYVDGWVAFINANPCTGYPSWTGCPK